MYTYPVVEGLEITIDIVQYLITWFRPRFILKLAEKKKFPKLRIYFGLWVEQYPKG